MNLVMGMLEFVISLVRCGLVYLDINDTVTKAYEGKTTFTYLLLLLYNLDGCSCLADTLERIEEGQGLPMSEISILHCNVARIKMHCK